jgi:hypothetical protein
MKFHLVAAALLGGAVVMFGVPTLAQTPAGDPLEDAMELLQSDPIAGLAAFERLAADGEVEAMNMVAAIIMDPPPGIAADPARALQLWEQALAGGSEGARLNLGTRLLLNDATDDDARAVALLRGVEPDFIPYAAYPLGRAYLFGHGVDQDLERGSRLMEMAVEQTPGNVDAQFLLARAYQNGWGIPADPDAAYAHMKIAADGGDPRAQWNVGMMLLDGVGVTANANLARQYVQSSAEAGYDEGMISMAVMLALGQGGPVDATAARGWYERAARHGSAHALRGLGMMILVGEGGAPDLATGAAYLQLAMEGGDEAARVLQQRLAPQIAAADPAKVRLAREQWLTASGPVR